MISKNDALGLAALVVAAVVIGIFNEQAGYVFIGAVVLVGVATNYQRVKTGLGL